MRYLSLAILTALLPGCAGAELHPDYAGLRPARIAVLPVEDATGRELDRVSFAGLAGRVIGPEVHDVPALLRGVLADELFRRGYTAVAPEDAGAEDDGEEAAGGGETAAGDEAAGAPDARLETTILSWRQGFGGGTSFAMSYRLVLHAPGLDAPLYRGTFTAQARPRPQDRSSGRLDEALRRSVRRALEALPPGPADGAPSPPSP